MQIEKDPVTDGPLMRVRFQVPGSTSPVNWPIPYPSWCSGSNSQGNYVVAYVKDTETLLKNWPDAFDIDVFEEGLQEFTYTDRFPRPEHMTPEGMAKALEEYKGYPVYKETGAFAYTTAGYYEACRAIRKFPNVGPCVDELDLDANLRIHQANAAVWSKPVELQEAMINAPVDPALWATRQLYLDLSKGIHDIIVSEVGLDYKECQYVTGQVMAHIGRTLQGDGVDEGYFVAHRCEPTVDLSLHMASYFDDINT
ncbi:hypothetical protein D3C87_1252290 [compost metagenome]